MITREPEEPVLQRAAELLEAQRAARLGSWIWNRETGVLFWSKELYRIAGRDPNLPPPRFQEQSQLYTPESWERLKCAVEEALRTGEPYELDLQIIRPDGSTRWITDSGEALRDDAGRITWLRGTAQDITERKRAKEALRESEERLRLAVQAGKMYAYEWDVASDAVVRSEESVNILRSMGEPISLTRQQLIAKVHPDDRAHFIAAVDALTPEKPTTHITYRVIRGDGSVSWLEKHGRAFFDSGGRMLRMIGIVADVTERKVAENALQESEQRFRSVADTAPVLIWMSGTDKQCTYFNRPWLDFTGRSMEQELGNGWAEGVHPDDLQRCLDTYQQSFDRREKFRMEYRLRRHDGEYRWIIDIGVPRLNQDRSFAGYIGIAVDVTERRRAEETRSRLAAIVESSEDAIASATLDGIIVSWNTGALHMYGYTEAEAVGKPTTILAPPELPDQQKKILETLKLGGRIEQLETVRVTKTGKRINVSLSISPIKDSSGTIVGAAGIARDITERKMAEEKLREYEKAVEGAEDMIGVVDREYRFLLANRQYLKMRNLTREQVVGHLIPEVLGAEIFETVIKPKLDECFQGKVVSYEMKFSYPTFGERDLSLSYFPIEGVNGVDRAVCILRDITDRKRAEDALVELNRTLEAQSALLQSSEELLKIFVKNVPAAVAMLDRDMRYMQVSDRWCTGYLPGRAEVLGRSHYEIFPDMPERWKEVHRRCLEGETLRADEDRWDGKDGPHWARWEVRPWKTAEGIVGGILILAEDITPRKQMEETLSRLTRRLIESQEQERSRIGRELHDVINQQIAMLAVELEQLQNDPSDVQNRLQELRKQMSELSNDVQALSHELHSSKLEYLGVVSGMRSWCKEFGERQNVMIDFESDVSSVVPFEIGISLFRVLQEALHNAAKHSGVKRIEVQLREHSGEIHLIVRDSGRGFDIEAARQGRGLGLTSMQERIRLVNGTITIESKPTGGTTIHVRVRVQSEHYAQGAAG